MIQQEKKYRVDSLDLALHFFSEKNIAPSQMSTTNHFYGQQSGNNVTKLVQYSDKYEIHILEEADGVFSLVEKISVDSVDDGLNWLRSQGFEFIDEIKMWSQTFEYKGGLVRLYLIDDWLHSIILSHPHDQLKDIEKELKLKPEEVIEKPYNKFLTSLGMIKTRKL